MVSIIEISGKQFTITPGEKISVPFQASQPGEVISVTDLISNAPVQLEVVEHGRDEKVTSRKFRNKTRYLRTKGHRQSFTVVTLKEAKPKKAKSEDK